MSFNAFKTARIYRYELPLIYPLPLKTTRLTVRRGLVVELVNDSNQYFYGEAAPLPDFSRESIEEAEKQLQQILPSLWGEESLNTNQDLFPSVAFAVESAVYAAQKQGWMTAEVGQAPLLLGSDSAVIQRLDNWGNDWPNEFKFKVGRQSVASDIQSVQNIFKVVPESVRLRLDANQRWTRSMTCEFAREIPVERISYLEEPTEKPEEFTGIYQSTGLYYALDETLQGGEMNIDWREGLAALILKPSLVGGIQHCRRWVDLANRQGVRVIFSSSFESHLGVGIIEQLSKELAPGESPGLDTLSAFSDPLCDCLPDPGHRLSTKTRERMEQVWNSGSAH